MCTRDGDLGEGSGSYRGFRIDVDTTWCVHVTVNPYHATLIVRVRQRLFLQFLFVRLFPPKFFFP